MRSEAATVEEYLNELPEERRAALSVVREEILRNLPQGIVETMNWGMITYEVPLEVCPETYNGQPLMFAALASQKNHMAVYLTGIYMEEDARKEFEAAYRATGKRFDAGKSCVRFRTLEQLPVELIGGAVAAMDMDEFVRRMDGLGSARKARNRRS
jgi:uncharacterized protein YdhG (YjbR/CyaY superfamily)